MRKHRHSVVALLGAACVLAGPANAAEISPKQLEYETKVRAAFSPAQKAHVSALEARLTTKMTVHDVITMTQGEPAGSVFAFMMAYQKMLNKETRRDRQQARQDALLSVEAKAQALRRENDRIDEAMKEAAAKADSLMNAANASLVTGVAAGAIQANVATRLGPTPTPTPRPR